MNIDYKFLTGKIKKELIAIIEIVISELTWDLSIRTGYYENEYLMLLNKLRNNIVDEMAVSLSVDELSMLHQALNEFYHGFDNSRWEHEILINKEEGEALMSRIKELIE